MIIYLSKWLSERIYKVVLDGKIGSKWEVKSNGIKLCDIDQLWDAFDQFLNCQATPCECYFIQERSKDVSFVPLWHVIRTVTVKFYLEQLMLLSVYETSMVNDWKQWSLKPQLR